VTVTAALIIVRICFSDGRLHYGGIQPVSIDRVATNVENLEYSAISLNTEFSGNSVQSQRKIITDDQTLFTGGNFMSAQPLSFDNS